MLLYGVLINNHSQQCAVWPERKHTRYSLLLCLPCCFASLASRRHSLTPPSVLKRMASISRRLTCMHLLLIQCNWSQVTGKQWLAEHEPDLHQGGCLCE